MTVHCNEGSNEALCKMLQDLRGRSIYLCLAGGEKVTLELTLEGRAGFSWAFQVEETACTKAQEQ